MKTTLIKFLLLCLTFVLVFSFAACKGNEGIKDADSAAESAGLESDADDLIYVSSAEADASSDALSSAEVKTSSDASSSAEAAVSLDSTAAAKEESPSESQQQKPANEVKPKYSDAEIYEKEGKKYSKTEDGEEVEISGDNMQKMMEDYQKVQGTGSEKEREILDRMQVILDNAEELQ